MDPEAVSGRTIVQRIKHRLAGMSLPSEHERSRPTLLLALSLGGLLVAIALTGVAGLTPTRNVHDITERALNIDVNLEDEADDLRGAILDIRNFHRDLVFEGPDSTTLLNLDTARLELQEQLNDYAEIDLEPIPGIVPAGEMQARSDLYWRDFRAGIAFYESDPAKFEAASTTGLERLNELEGAAEALDRLGERRAETSLANVDSANTRARNILLGVLGGLVLVGATLVWVTIRVISQFRQLYNSQQQASARLGLALQAKSDFIADASHELRTPLTVLRGNSEAGLAIDGNSIHREILEEIVSESARMTKLVEYLLFLARSDAYSVPIHREAAPA